jgi:hypothetical protein
MARSVSSSDAMIDEWAAWYTLDLERREQYSIFIALCEFPLGV